MGSRSSEARSLAGSVGWQLDQEFDRIQDGKPYRPQVIDSCLTELQKVSRVAYEFYQSVYASLNSNQ